MKLRKTGIISVIISCFFLAIYFYKTAKIEEIESALNEHVLVITEPLWNYDTEPLEYYLEAVAGKNKYQSLKITDESGAIVYEIHKKDIHGIEDSLVHLGLIPTKKIQKDIIYDKQLIGKLDVIWRDTSIYFFSYTFLISLLLIVITNLYSRIFLANKALEGRVEEKEKDMAVLQSQKEYIEDIFNVVPEGLITLDREHNILDNNQSFDLIIENWATIFNKNIKDIRDKFLRSLQLELAKKVQGHYTITIDGQTIHLAFSSSAVPSFSNIASVVSIRDTTETNEMRRKLAHTQKLESVGRLAAGIAHEINTPTQYVLSNIDFLIDCNKDVAKVMTNVGTLIEKSEEKISSDDVSNLLAQPYEDADWEYLQEEIPKALLQSQEGLRRISGIVSGMKQFSHPSGDSPELSDLNKAIENTVTVTTNEWKYIAELNLELAPSLPMVPCYLDELNQVFLAMIVNSAHAIEEKNGKESGEKGKITIKTEVNNETVVVTISDNGNGIPKAVLDKVFDPFFTTKEVNKGTGQGLAIAHDVIVDRHNGSIIAESEEGNGTTFTISLPLESES